MDENAPPESPPPGFNKIDLTQLQGFSFGTQWTQDKSTGRESRRDDRPFRDDGPNRRDDRGAPERRDRRAFRKSPADGPSAPGGGGTESRTARAQPGGAPEGARERGGPRRDGAPGERWPSRGGPVDRGPYDSPYFSATFYPEDSSFATLAKTIRASCRTFELFEIAKTVIAKPDRFVVVLHRKSAPAAPAGASGEPAKPAPIAVSAPDNIPFESEDAAIAHVLSRHLGLFFDVAEVDVEPPKGNFQVVNKCGMTGELLGPPNYHRYSQIIQRHHAAKLPRVSFEAFRSRIESVRDPEIIAQWIEKMKKATRYTFKTGATPPPQPASEEGAAAGAVASVDTAPAAPEAPPVAEAQAPGEKPAPAEASVAEAPAFDSIEDARNYLVTQVRGRVVKLVDGARFQGKVVDTFPPGEIRRALDGALERQQRFPLDTANALRGRLRREGFTIFKKGSKGISYVCAVKRKFRVSGQVFADSINNLITYVENNPMVKAGDLPAKLLGIASVQAPAAAAAESGAASAPAPLPPADRERIQKMQGDLRWLVHEGYVTEFLDGALYAPPPMVEARRREIEASEHDPENFPETQAAAPATSRDAAPLPPSDRAESSAPVGPDAGAEPSESPTPRESAPVSSAETASPGASS